MELMIDLSLFLTLFILLWLSRLKTNPGYWVSPHPKSRIDSEDISVDEAEIARPEPSVPERPAKSLFCLHLTLLLWKNYKLFSRSLKLTLFQLATPVFFCLLIVYLQWLTDSYTSLSMPNPTSDVGPMQHCIGEDCITIGYGIIVRILKSCLGNWTWKFARIWMDSSCYEIYGRI